MCMNRQGLGFKRFFNHFFFPSAPLFKIVVGSCFCFTQVVPIRHDGIHEIFLERSFTLVLAVIRGSVAGGIKPGDMVMSEASPGRHEMKGNNQQ